MSELNNVERLFVSTDISVNLYMERFNISRDMAIAYATLHNICGAISMVDDVSFMQMMEHDGEPYNNEDVKVAIKNMGYKAINHINGMVRIEENNAESV